MNYRKIFTAMLFLVGLVTFSQDITISLKKKKFDKAYQIRIGADAGILSGLLYDSDIVESEGTFNYGVGLTLVYYFNDFVGFESGVQFTPFKADLKLTKEKFSTPAMDNDINRGNEAFMYNLITKDYREKLNIDIAEIPIRIVYDLGRRSDKKLGYFGSLGTKILIPLKQESKVYSSYIETTGTYPSIKAPGNIFKDMENHGFYKWKNYKVKTITDLGLSITASAEIGLNYKITNANMVYLGLFGDYAVLSMKKNENSNTSVLPYNPEGTPIPSGGLSSYDGVKSVKMYSCGAFLKFTLF